jgi:hypothetical protein
MSEDTRCTHMVPMRTGMYRCTLESNYGPEGKNHTEHQYNYYRKLTDEEFNKYFKPDEDDDYDSDCSLD